MTSPDIRRTRPGRPAWQWRRRLPRHAAACVALIVFGGLALGGPPAEAPIKAAFVYNFAKYAKWPESAFAAADSRLLICSLGRDDETRELASMEMKPIQGRAVVYQPRSTAEDLRGCHVAYIAESEEKSLADVLQALRGAPVLTVAEFDGFASGGGMIGLYVAESRVRFEVNLAAVRATGLQLGSNLLKLARIIRD